MKIYNVIGSAILAAGLAATAHATPVAWSGASAPGAGITGTSIQTTPISDTFSGRAQLSKSCFGIPINLTCTLELAGNVTASGADVTLTITDGQSLGPTSGGLGLLNCTDVSFSNFDWTATVDQSGLPSSAIDTTPVLFNVKGVHVDTICGDCSGDIDATFRNVGRGEFTFDGTLAGSTGSCGVSGTLDSSPTANSTAGSGLYYRVWNQ